MKGIRQDALPSSTARVCLLLPCFAALAAILGGAGCRHALRSAPAAEAVPPNATAAAQSGIPFPAQTPFDHDRSLRTIYLMAFAQGYSLAASGSAYASPGCLCEAEGNTDRYNASLEGFLDGRRAGEAAFHASGANGREVAPGAER